MDAKVGAALVVGGGIAGNPGSLDLANAGIKVYLLITRRHRRRPHGPTGQDLPDERLRHVHHLAEARGDGAPSEHRHPHRFRAPLPVGRTGQLHGAGAPPSPVRGHGQVHRLRRLRAAVCPIGLKNEFNAGLDDRKAVYRPYPQAVPNSFLVTKRGTSPCKAACPAETSAQGYVALIREGRYAEALEVVRQHNPFPASVGRVCTHPCETACSRGKVDSPVAICALKRFVADWVHEHGSAEATAPSAGDGITDRPAARVAVVGAGPAGLSCAFYLARMGYGSRSSNRSPWRGG